MSKLLLSVFALFLGGMPEADAARPDRDFAVDAIFRDYNETPVSRPLERPRWLKGEQKQKTIFRGQSGTFDSPPMSSPLGGTYQPYQPVNPYQPLNPFQPGADPVLPFLNDPGPTVLSGINGPQPERYGFTPVFDGTFIAPSTAKGPAKGHLAVQEYDGSLRHSSMIWPEWTLTNTLQGGARIWDGPSSPDLPGTVFRAGWDFLLSTPQAGAWSAQFDFNPSINSDFKDSLGREAFNFDGSATAFYRTSPQLMFVLGVQYWDRVDKIIIPNAGVVWNPTDKLELRLMFPKSRISYFLGNWNYGDHWLYATGEYHVESFQIHSTGVSSREQIQFSDYRFGIGLRSDHSWYDKFLEVGYVIGRQAEFLHSGPKTQDFNISDGIMVRFGVRF